MGKNKIITVENINEIKFYKMPKAFFHNPIYVDMKNESKIAYIILRDLLTLSVDNDWINENNEVYVKLSREKMMKRLNIKGTAKYAEVMKELSDKELIVKRRVGLNMVDETYVCLPDELSVLYSDKELLILEESGKFENKTSKGLKKEPPKVLKSNPQRFENQTHTNTNITNTNITKTNITISSSKGKAIGSVHSLVEMFNGSICELKKTTTPKFMMYVEKYDKEFIETIISYCESKGAKTYSYFEKTIKAYLADGITSKKEVEDSISNFKNENRKSKNRAIAEKEIVKKNKREAIESMIGDSEVAINLVDGEDLNFIKEQIKEVVTDVTYKTWFRDLNIKNKDSKVYCICPNSFTMELLSKRYTEHFRSILSHNNLNADIKFVVME